MRLRVAVFRTDDDNTDSLDNMKKSASKVAPLAKVKASPKAAAPSKDVNNSLGVFGSTTSPSVPACAGSGEVSVETQRSVTPVSAEARQFVEDGLRDLCNSRIQVKN